VGLALLAVLAWRGLGPSGHGGGAGCASAASMAGEDEVRIVADEFCFAPGDVALPRGRPVTLVLENRGKAAHDFAVPELGVRLVADPGGTARATVTVDQPGRYEAVCSFPGHERMGMTGTVTVP
jgi:uncharacterized cupredoxin-like copper-binding protein